MLRPPPWRYGQSSDDAAFGNCQKVDEALHFRMHARSSSSLARAFKHQAGFVEDAVGALQRLQRLWRKTSPLQAFGVRLQGDAALPAAMM